MSFDSPRETQPDSYEVRFDDLNVLGFHYRVVQLNNLSWKDFVKHENPIAAALMAKMNIVREDRARVKSECLNLLSKLKRNPAESRLIGEFVDTYLRLSTYEMTEYENLQNRLHENERKELVKMTTSWERKGIKQGLQRGLEKGRLKGSLEGRLELIERLLNRRIGSVDDATLNIIRKLSAEQLDELGEALLDFARIDDLKQWLKTNVSY